MAKKDTATKAKKDEVVVEEIKEAKAAVKRPEPVDSSTPILIYNNTAGILLCNDDKIPVYLELSQFGDSADLLFGELKRVVHHTYLKNIVHNGWIFIDNEDAVRELRLEKIYENMVHPNELDELFDNGDVERIEYLMNNAPSGMKDAIIVKTKEKIHNGTLDSIKIEKIVSELGKIKFR